MAYVVTQPCYDCKYTDCVIVCPMQCFHEGDHMLYIDPVECIDCDACRPECPVDAIFFENDVPDDQKEYIPLNAQMAKVCPSITERKQTLAGDE